MDEKNDNYGTIYCISNESFPENFFKVGHTIYDPKIIIKQLYTTELPTPYKIEFAKTVKHPLKNANCINKILSDFGCRVNPNRDFFKCPIEIILNLFELMDGSWYIDEENENGDPENPQYIYNIKNCLTEGIYYQLLRTSLM